MSKEVIGVSKETFNAIVEVLANMPYKQVGQVMDTLRAEVMTITVPDESDAPKVPDVSSEE
jgi:hypothetical protein